MAPNNTFPPYMHVLLCHQKVQLISLLFESRLALWLILTRSDIQRPPSPGLKALAASISFLLEYSVLDASSWKLAATCGVSQAKHRPHGEWSCSNQQLQLSSQADIFVYKAYFTIKILNASLKGKYYHIGLNTIIQPYALYKRYSKIKIIERLKRKGWAKLYHTNRPKKDE